MLKDKFPLRLPTGEEGPEFSGQKGPATPRTKFRELTKGVYSFRPYNTAPQELMAPHLKGLVWRGTEVELDHQLPICIVVTGGQEFLPFSAPYFTACMFISLLR